MTEKEIRAFDGKLGRTCTQMKDFGQEFEKAAFKMTCCSRVLGPDQLLWHFEDFNEFTYSCWKSLCDASAGSSNILLGREPLLSKDKTSRDD